MNLSSVFAMTSHPFESYFAFHVVFILLFVLASLSFVYDVAIRLAWVFNGMPEDRKGNYGQKIKSFFVNVVLQKKLYKHPIRGIMHVSVFYGFLYYLIHTGGQIVGGLFIWTSNPYHFHLVPADTAIGEIYNKGIDYISLIVLFGLIVFALRRWVFKAKELDRPSGQSALVISIIGLLMISTLFANAALLVAVPGHNASFSAISYFLSGLFYSGNAVYMHQFFWWVHILLVFAFMVIVPKSKHSHLIFGPFNYWWPKLTPKGQLKTIDLEDENLESWGAANIKEFNWPQLLDGLACIECGRCMLACPANATGKVLNPKNIMNGMKHALMEKMPDVMAGKEDVDSRVIDNYVTYEELWGCTTCYACVEACPVGNVHVDTIVDMRRALVLNDSKMPSELQGAFTNMENNSNPWGVGAHLREEWAEGLDIKKMADVENPEDVEYLYFVGCAGSFDDRSKKIAVSFVNIMNKAGVKFAILGNEENCTGDSARRAGNEYLFQTLAATNVETFNNYKVKKIVAPCPHCLNTIKNEYPQFGGNYEVVHHSELINSLIKDGKIKVDSSKMPQDGNIAFHDSCYLGRYNDIYSPPRDLIKEATGKAVTEIDQCKENGFCCGAGGAQMWMEELEGDRINNVRTDQLLEANPTTIGTSCPFCITMISDGIKDRGKQEEVKVLDIAEIVEKAMV